MKVSFVTIHGIIRDEKGSEINIVLRIPSSGNILISKNNNSSSKGMLMEELSNMLCENGLIETLKSGRSVTV